MIMKHLVYITILLFSVIFNLLTSETLDPGRSILKQEDINNADCTYNVNKSGGLSKNGTLKPSDECVWHIFGNDSSSGLLFEKVHLDATDVLTILDVNGTTLFGPYKGSPGPLVIAVNEQNFTVKLTVSSQTASRGFQLLYSENCIFSIPPSIDVIESPIYKAKNELITCTYDFNKITEGVGYNFVFKSFRLVDGSELEVSKADGPNGFYKTTPPDIFGPLARFNMTLNISTTENNLTIVRRDLYEPCTKYIEIPNMRIAPVLRSPPKMTSDNDSVNFECRWLIKNNDASGVIGLVMDKLQFSSIFDMLNINNGPSELSPPLTQANLINQEEIKGQVIKSGGQYLWISFKSEDFASNFSGNCSQGKGGYYRGSGSISSQSDAEFLLEVDVNKKVLLNISSSDLASPAVLSIYDDFSTSSAQIAQLSGNIWYPVVSGTSKMRVVAKNFDAGKAFTAEFSGITTDCIHMSALSDDSYVVSGNCNMTCVWIVPAKNVSEKVLVLEFHLVSLDVNDVIEIFRLGDSQTPIAKILHDSKHVPPLTFDPREGFYMNVSRGICKSEEVILVAHATYLPGCSRNFSLVPSSDVQLSTPNYPNMYPLFASCEWDLSLGSTKQFYLAFESINLAPGHCIQINHTVEGATKTEVIAGSELPSDMLFQNVKISFDSFNCNKPSAAVPLVSGEGFILNITSSDCGSIMNAKTGQFNTSLPASKGSSACFWIIEVPYSESDGSVNSVMFTVEKKDMKNNNSEFYVHDGSSVRECLVTNYTGNIWSHNNTVIFIYKRFNSSVSSDVYTINYKTINCNKTNQCGNGICLHPDWRCNGKNDCGDFTDERNCGTIPVPEPQKETNNVSPVTFGIVTVLFFILGALAAFLIPKAVNRYRSGRYHQFQDYPNVD